MQGIGFKATIIIVALCTFTVFSSQTFSAGCMGCHQSEVSSSANEIIDKREYTQRQENQKQNSVQEVNVEEVLPS